MDHQPFRSCRSFVSDGRRRPPQQCNGRLAASINHDDTRTHCPFRFSSNLCIFISHNSVLVCLIVTAVSDIFAGFFLTFCVMVRFSPSLLPHPGLHGAHPALMSPGHAALSAGLHGVKQEPGLPMGLLVDQNHRYAIDGKSRHLPASRSGRR